MIQFFENIVFKPLIDEKLRRQFLSWSINEYTAVYTTVDYEIYWATKSHFQKKYANSVITN